jgi:hypothetical protein
MAAPDANGSDPTEHPATTTKAESYFVADTVLVSRPQSSDPVKYEAHLNSSPPCLSSRPVPLSAGYWVATCLRIEPPPLFLKC